MKKEKFLCCFLVSFLLFSCKVGYEGGGGASPSRKSLPHLADYVREAPDHIDLPLLNGGGSKRVDVAKGYYIVRTPKDFDKSAFIKMGAVVQSVMKADEGNVFWRLYKNDEFFIKKVLRLKGVISAEYDFMVYHIKPPKDSLEQLTPGAGEGDKNDFGGKYGLKPLGLEEGNMDLDPRMKEVNYSLQITHALRAYKEFKDDHFKKPVLLGIIDTGFNYCNEDFWFTNTNNKEESIAYFVKSPFLISMSSRDFDYTLGVPLDEDDPSLAYARPFLKAYRYTSRFFEVPCTKVDPGPGNNRYTSPDCILYWNWDNGEHGTHCTGMMAAVGNNGKGVAGVSWKNTKIAAYKCFGGQPSGAWEIYGALDDYAEYIEHGKAGTLNQLYSHDFESVRRRDGIHTSEADNPYTDEQTKFNPYKDQGIYPINMSLGGAFPSQFAAIVIARCLRAGILPVVAMGNDGQRLAEYPASFEGVLSVGATDGRDRKKHFSCSGEWIDICAPGDGILSTGITPQVNYPWAVGHPELNTRPWGQSEISKAYTTMSGTSMATPFTTGVLGYLLSFDHARGKDPGWIRAILQSTADPLEGQAKGEHHEDYGYGRVNVYEAAKAVKANTSFAGDPKWDCNTNNYVVIRVKNKRSKSVDSDGNVPNDNDLGLSGHPIVVYEEGSGDPKGFSFTNNVGRAEFFFLPKLPNKGRYVARVNIDGESYETSFEVKDFADDKERTFTIEYDAPTIYISTIAPHSSIYNKYSANGEYNKDVDTIISIYEEGNLEEPIERFDYYTLDTLAFNAKPGKTYFAEITCFADPTTGLYRTGIYGFRIGYEGFFSGRKGSNNFLDPMVVDKDKRQSDTGRLIYDLVRGFDCWEPNDSFEEARARGDFMDFAKKVDLKSYIICCLTNQSDGLDKDIFMFKAPEWDEED